MNGYQNKSFARSGQESEFFVDNLLVRIHFIIEMIWWTGLSPWEFELPFPGSLISTFLCFCGVIEPTGVNTGRAMNLRSNGVLNEAWSFVDTAVLVSFLSLTRQRLYESSLGRNNALQCVLGTA